MTFWWQPLCEWEAHEMSTIGQPTAVPSIHPTPRQILGSLQHTPMLPSTFNHCWPPCASNSELPEPDMLAAHSHLHQRLCNLMQSTFQCHKGLFPPAVWIHHTFASVILVQRCQAFVAWEGVTQVCSGGWAMGPVGRDYPEGQWVVLRNHSIHHHNPIWHCSGLINSHKKCHRPQDCPWNHHHFQLGDLALRSCWCVGWSGESIQVLIQVFKRVWWRRRTKISRPLCCVVHIKRFSWAITVSAHLLHVTLSLASFSLICCETSHFLCLERPLYPKAHLASAFFQSLCVFVCNKLSYGVSIASCLRSNSCQHFIQRLSTNSSPSSSTRLLKSLWFSDLESVQCSSMSSSKSERRWITPPVQLVHSCYVTVGTFARRGLGSVKQRHWVVLVRVSEF